MVLGKVDIHRQKKKEKNLDLYLIPYTKSNYKSTTETDINAETIKLL